MVTLPLPDQTERFAPPISERAVGSCGTCICIKYTYNYICIGGVHSTGVLQQFLGLRVYNTDIIVAMSFSEMINLVIIIKNNKCWIKSKLYFILFLIFIFYFVIVILSKLIVKRFILFFFNYSNVRNVKIMKMFDKNLDWSEKIFLVFCCINLFMNKLIKLFYYFIVFGVCWIFINNRFKNLLVNFWNICFEKIYNNWITWLK